MCRNPVAFPQREIWGKRPRLKIGEIWRKFDNNVKRTTLHAGAGAEYGSNPGGKTHAPSPPPVSWSPADTHRARGAGSPPPRLALDRQQCTVPQYKHSVSLSHTTSAKPISRFMQRGRAAETWRKRAEPSGIIVRTKIGGDADKPITHISNEPTFALANYTL